MHFNHFNLLQLKSIRVPLLVLMMFPLCWSGLAAKFVKKTKTVTYDNLESGFSLILPKKWKMHKMKEDGLFILYCQEKNEVASVTVNTLDMGFELELDTFIKSMEDEFAKELPQLEMDSGVEVESIFDPVDPSVREMKFKQYPGDYEGYKLTFLVGYQVVDKTGYTLAGFYVNSDSYQRDLVKHCMSSFRILETMESKDAE